MLTFETSTLLKLRCTVASLRPEAATDWANYLRTMVTNIQIIDSTDNEFNPQQVLNQEAYCLLPIATPELLHPPS